MLFTPWCSIADCKPPSPAQGHGLASPVSLVHFGHFAVSSRWLGIASQECVGFIGSQMAETSRAHNTALSPFCRRTFPRCISTAHLATPSACTRRPVPSAPTVPVSCLPMLVAYILSYFVFSFVRRNTSRPAHSAVASLSPSPSPSTCTLAPSQTSTWLLVEITLVDSNAAMQHITETPCRSPSPSWVRTDGHADPPSFLDGVAVSPPPPKPHLSPLSCVAALATSVQQYSWFSSVAASLPVRKI